MDATNPATGARWHVAPTLRAEAIPAVLDAVAAAQRDWRGRPVAARSAVLARLGETLREHAPAHARLMAQEMGKPVRDGVAEVEKCAALCDHYAAQLPSIVAPRPVATEASRSYVSFAPLGLVLAVMPWNYPFWQVIRCAAPAIGVGNGVVLKHASNVPGCALALETAFREAGFPNDLFRALLIDSDDVAGVIEDPRVRAVSLTGSTAAGRIVAERAGKALKKTVLELGGSDPYVVLADADLDAAAATCVKSRFVNGGQSCIAAKRFIVVEPVAAAFEERVLAIMRDMRTGDPLDESTKLGPMARRDLRDELHGQVQESVAAGARLVLGGVVPDGPGAFYPPTLLADVGPGMPAYDDEIFGPVAAIVPARDEDDAIRIANDTAFGLGAAVFSENLDKAEEIARDRLEAGCCFVNEYVRSDPRLPFGGVKDSGFGRELGEFGPLEFVNTKTVYVR